MSRTPNGGSTGEYKDKIVDSDCEAVWEDGGRTGEKPAVFHEPGL